MYVPRYAEQTDVAALHEFIAAHPFGTLVTAAGGLEANHFPFLLDAEEGTLWTHLARANPQTAALRGGAPCLAVFAGPHAYVSPALYAGALNVPTWNYTAVHARCEAELVEDDAAIEDILKRTVARFDDRWTYDLPADFTAQLRRAIVGVRLRIAALEGKFKLSQNRDAADRAAVLAGFEARSDDNSRALAAYMRKTDPRRS
ncbi:MAG: FMN-binding negative transcriptional regulator [Elusimicrobia bacterium]|nr:FMN-binding negative transcriptional regulator [Elusimicrobiota bacterium]